MNAPRASLSLFLLFALAACSVNSVGYNPQECPESCDARYRECLRERPADQARDAYCAQQRERCLDACLTTPCNGPACEGNQRHESCDARYRECLRDRPDDQARVAYCTQQRERCLRLGLPPGSE